MRRACVGRQTNRPATVPAAPAGQHIRSVQAEEPLECFRRRYPLIGCTAQRLRLGLGMFLADNALMADRHRPRFALPATLLVLMALVLAGCTATVKFPAPGAVDAPRPVFLVEHGWHTSLVLTREDESMVRYVYGDWRWYAEQETGALRVLPTLFARTQGALGRASLESPASERALRAQTRVVIDDVHAFEASASRVEALLERLDARFVAARDTRQHSAAYGLDFVHDDKPYTLWDNSNHVVVEWLRELDVEVTGNPLYGRWRISHD